MQSPVELTLGTAGLTVPRLPGPAAPAIDRDYQPVKAICFFRQLASSTITNGTSRDGVLWHDNIVGAPLSTFTGPGVRTYEPLLPGMGFRLTSSEAQADTKAFALPANTDAAGRMKYTSRSLTGTLGHVLSVEAPAPTNGQALHITRSDKAITIHLAADVAQAATETIGGLVYAAKVPGAAGNSISVAQTAPVGAELDVQMVGSAPDWDVLVQLATTPAVKSSVTNGGLVWTAATAGVAGDSTTVTLLAGTSQTLHASTSTTDVTIQLGTDEAGAVTSTPAQIAAEIALHAPVAALVAVGSTGTPVAATSKNLAGGDDGGVVTCTALDIGAKIAADPAIAAVIECGIVGTLTAASETHLANGADVAHTTTAAQLKAAFDSVDGAGETCEHIIATINDNGDGVGHLVEPFAHTHLSGGVDVTVSVYFAPSYDQYVATS